MKKPEKIAVETLTLKELSKLFRESVMIGLPRSERSINKTFNELKRAKISSYRWVKSYEIFKGAQLNFYCIKDPGAKEPIIAVGMTHRTPRGMVLMFVDPSNSGFTDLNSFLESRSRLDEWLVVYTSHCCKRFAERIMKSPEISFKIGSEGIMFWDLGGKMKIAENKVFEGVDEVTYQFNEGQAYGYRDRKNKVTLFRTVYSNDMISKKENLELMNEWKSSTQDLKEIFSLE